MAKKKKKAKKKSSRGLVIQRLENLSKALFKDHYKLITKLVGSSPGVYALYDGEELYYVGKSTALRKRVKHHLRDRHFASWTHFSLYLVRTASHISEIESLLVRIANPKGNRLVPKGKASSAMLKKLKSMVKEKQNQEFKEMFGTYKPKHKEVRRKSAIGKKKLKGLVHRSAPLYRTYKGKEYKAILTPGGIIKIGNKSFTTPTAAAKAITKRRTINGWKFWYIKDANGVWVRLSDYRG